MSKPNSNSPRNSPEKDQIFLSLFRVLMTTVKLLVVGVCLTILYTFFGDSFNFNVENKKNNPRQNTQSSSKSDTNDWDKVENGIHLATGLIYADNFDIVRANCTPCHSGKLVAQNRATRDGWLQMIRWMQDTQGLWDLGVNEPKILDYLATNYAPENVGRRANIDIASIEWYILNIED